LFFATLRDRAGTRALELDIPEGMTVRGLKERLAAERPELKSAMQSVLISINREYAFDEALVPPNAEVAMFPPVSGGNGPPPPTLAYITEEAIEIDRLLAQIALPTSGAVAIFAGLVRGLSARPELRQTAYLEYEAYLPMAEAKMRQVAEEIRARWPAVEGIAIVQRIGRLHPQTPTVLIACTAAHRDTGVFEAARYGIDRLKEIVPIWKKEVSPDGEFWVEGEYLPRPGE